MPLASHDSTSAVGAIPSPCGKGQQLGVAPGRVNLSCHLARPSSIRHHCLVWQPPKKRIQFPPEKIRATMPKQYMGYRTPARIKFPAPCPTIACLLSYSPCNMNALPPQRRRVSGSLGIYEPMARKYRDAFLD